MFKFLYRFHIYGGLFGSIYLFVVGLSAFNMQHHLIPSDVRDTLVYDLIAEVDTSLNAENMATSLMKQIGIVGFYSPWDQIQDADHFACKIFSPARQYNLHVDYGSGKVHVEEILFGFGAVIDVLHTAILVELDDPLLIIWAYFGQLSAAIVILAIATGVYFWFRKSIRKKRDWVIVIAASVITCSFILYIWLVG